MGVKYMAAFAVSGILTVAAESAWAGADGNQKATKQQLTSSGTELILPEQSRRLQPQSEPAQQSLEPPELNSMTGMSDIPGPYLNVDTGFGLANNPDDSQSADSMTAENTDNFGVISGGAGYRLSHNLRSDLMFSLRPEADVESAIAEGNRNESEMDALTVMFNGYVNFANLGRVRPYIGADLRYARLSTGMQRTSGGNTSESGAVANNLAYSVMGSAAITINDRASLNIALLRHEIKAGLRFQF